MLEFRSATYSCKADGKFGDDNSDTFDLVCPQGGEFPDTVEWPECNIEHCTQIPTLNGFVKLTSSPVSVGGYALYECETDGHVTNNGPKQQLLCTEDGSFDIDAVDNWPVCRVPVDCTQDKPTPPESTHLLASQSTVSKEFEIATYLCKEHYKLDTHPSGYKIQCGLTGVYPETIEWPECIPSHCPEDIPVINGFITLSTAPLPVGRTANYKCETEGYVTDLAKVHAFKSCNALGLLEDAVSSDGLVCREAITCGAPPTAPSDTFLQFTETYPDTINEHESVTYKCSDGYNLDSGSVESGFTLVDLGNGTKFVSVKCQDTESFSSISTWPQCVGGRRKRFIAYEGLKADVKYSLNVIFETQWRYSNAIKDDIFTTTPENITFEDYKFPKAIIDVFHQRVDEVIESEDMGALKLKFPVFPSCEQPMTAFVPKGCKSTYSKINCALLLYIFHEN